MIAVARRLWLTLLTLALAAVCLIAGAAVRSAADTPAPSRLQVSMPGDHGNFSADPSGPLMDFHRLAPGGSITGVMGVRNLSNGLADLSLQMVDARVPDQCGSTGASCQSTQRFTELLRFSVSVADAENGSYDRIWSGSVDDLSAGVQIARALPNNHSKWLRLAAHFARNADDSLQRAELHFGLRIRLDAGLLGATTKTLGGAHRPEGIHVAGLAVTGTQLEWIMTVALGLLGAGGALTLLGRRRTPRSSAHRA